MVAKMTLSKAWNARAANRLRIRTRAMLVALVILPMLSGCDFLGFKNWTWNQRLILEVETPQGSVSGGSVIAIEVGSSPRWAPGTGAGGMSGRVAAGEASFVEIAPGRYLFALLDDATEQMPYYAFFPADDKDRERQATELEAMRATGEVPRNRYPLLVTFTDINDPSTVRRVDPGNLNATFGSGISLKSITLEITDEKVSKGNIQQLMNWLDWPRDRFLAGGGGESPLKVPGETIGRTNFVKG